MSKHSPIGFVVVDKETSELVSYIVFIEYDDAVQKVKENSNWCIAPIFTVNSHDKLVEALKYIEDIKFTPDQKETHATCIMIVNKMQEVAREALAEVEVK